MNPSEQDGRRTLQGPKPTDCEHEASHGDSHCLDTYLGDDDNGNEKWGRECLICGESREFVYNYDG